MAGIIVGWIVVALLGAYLTLALVRGRIHLRHGGYLTRDRRPAMFWFSFSVMAIGWAALCGVLLRARLA